jgi:hypothetical protein
VTRKSKEKGKSRNPPFEPFGFSLSSCVFVIETLPCRGSTLGTRGGGVGERTRDQWVTAEVVVSGEFFSPSSSSSSSSSFLPHVFGLAAVLLFGTLGSLTPARSPKFPVLASSSWRRRAAACRGRREQEEAETWVASLSWRGGRWRRTLRSW